MSNKGKKVKVHYTGTLDDGTKFDSSLDRGEPLVFTCLAGQMIAGFDNAVDQMTVGETVNVHIPAEQAYGPRDWRLVQRVNKDLIPNINELPEGERIVLTNPQGEPVFALVKKIEEHTVIFDMNHELAGCDLNFEITLLEVEE